MKKGRLLFCYILGISVLCSCAQKEDSYNSATEFTSVKIVHTEVETSVESETEEVCVPEDMEYNVQRDEDNHLVYQYENISYDVIEYGPQISNANIYKLYMDFESVASEYQPDDYGDMQSVIFNENYGTAYTRDNISDYEELVRNSFSLVDINLELWRELFVSEIGEFDIYQSGFQYFFPEGYSENHIEIIDSDTDEDIVNLPEELTIINILGSRDNIPVGINSVNSYNYSGVSYNVENTMLNGVVISNLCCRLNEFMAEDTIYICQIPIVSSSELYIENAELVSLDSCIGNSVIPLANISRSYDNCDIVVYGAQLTYIFFVDSERSYEITNDNLVLLIPVWCLYYQTPGCYYDELSCLYIDAISGAPLINDYYLH